MHFIRILAALIALVSTQALAQVTPGVGPSTAAKGGTGRSVLTDHCVLVGGGTAPVKFACPSSANTVLRYVAGDPSFESLAGADLPNPGPSSLGGVQSKSCSSSSWLNAISTSGVPGCAQPSFADISSSVALSQLPAFSGMSAAAAVSDTDTFPVNQGAGNLKQTLAAVKTWIKGWIVKADVGLGNVDNTSNATERATVRTLTNAAISGAANTISNLATSMFAANVIDPDTTLTANSDARLATQRAVKAYVDAGGGGGGGSYPDEARRNLLLNTIYQSKSFAEYRRAVNVFATGFKGASDATNGILTGSSSNYVVTPGTAGAATGNVAPTINAPARVSPNNMTSNVLPAPFVASASRSDINAPWNAYDGSVADPAGVWYASGLPNWNQLDFGTATAVGSYTIQHRAAGGADVYPAAWTIKGSNTGAFTGEEVTVDTQSGQVFSVSQTRTYTLSSPVSYRYLRITITASGGTVGALLGELTYFSPPTANNMTLVTAAQTADSAVSNARVLIEYDGTAVPTLNTDFTVEVTCDGGSHWTAATLSLVTSYSQGGRKIAETADTACTPGTDFRARIKILNGKNVPIYGVSATVH